MNTCKNCKYWAKLNKNSPAAVGECNLMDTLTMDKHVKNGAGAEISVYVHDDSGLNCSLIVGENFGCIYHTDKNLAP